jgi:hypothetical protein
MRHERNKEAALNRKLLQKAVAVHQQGNYEEAGRLYEEVARGA